MGQKRLSDMFRARVFLFSMMIFVPLVYGCGLSSNGCSVAESAEAIGNRILRASMGRDGEAMLALVHPNVLDFFEENDKLDLLKLYIYSEMRAFPAGVVDIRDSVHISKVGKEEIFKSNWTASAYRRIPEVGGEIYLLTIEYSKGDGGKNGKGNGLAIFVIEDGGCYYLAIPDVTEVLWLYGE